MSDIKNEPQAPRMLRGVAPAVQDPTMTLKSENDSYWEGYRRQVWIDTNTMQWVYVAYASFFVVLACYIIYRRWYGHRGVNGAGGQDKKRLLSSPSTSDSLLQQGYRLPLLGCILKYSLYFSAVLSQAICVAIWLSDAVIPAKLANKYWAPKAKAFIMAWCLSAFVIFGLRICWDSIQTIFMLNAPLGECTYVVIWRKNEDTGVEDGADSLSRKVASLRGWLGSFVGSVPQGWSRFIVPVTSLEGGSIRYYDLMCTRYIYCKESGTFKGSEGCMNLGVQEVTNVVFQKGLHESTVQRRLQDYGSNTIKVEVPPLLRAMGSAFSDPVMIFQLFCLYQMLYFRSTFTAILWTFMSVWGVSVQVFMVRRNQTAVRDMAESASRQNVKVLREGTRRTVLAENLVPGDVVEIEDDSDVPADIALVRGQVVVNEANLTGESIPVQKFTLPESDDLVDPEGKGGKKYYLFAGTHVITTIRGEKQTDESGREVSRAVGVVVRTGAATSKGQLVCDILFPNQFRFKYIDQMPVVFVILCVYAALLFIIQSLMVGFGPQSFFYGLTNVAQIVPIWVSVILGIGQNQASSRLADEKDIYCLAPARIAICGKIRVMCFDKTGTLTREGIDFIGVHPVAADRGNADDQPKYGKVVRWNELADSVTDAEVVSKKRQKGKSGKKESVAMVNAPTDMLSASTEKLISSVSVDFLQGLASCHALSIIEQNGKKIFVGSELERKMHQATGWSIDNNLIHPPTRVQDSNRKQKSAEAMHPLQVLKIFEFDHARQSMGVILKDVSTQEVFAFIKGSYERIGDFCTSGLPSDYIEVADGYAKEGMYVLGMAIRRLDSSIDVQKMTRDEFEKDATLLGLVLFRNELKPDTGEALRQLRDCRVRPVIITGDNALTAIAVARQSNIIRRSPAAIKGGLCGGVRAKTIAPAYNLQRRGGDSIVWVQQTSTDSEAHIGRPVLLGEVCDDKLQWRDVDTDEIVDSQIVYESDQYRELAVTATAFEYLLDCQTESEIYLKESCSDCEEDYSTCDDTESDSSCSVSTASGGAVSKHKKCHKHRRLRPLDQILPRIRIFARMNPQGKTAAIKLYMEKGYFTGMCGDGGNDCGALRAAHAGISLSDAEASIVSPFNAKSKTVSAIVELLKEGRGSLVTSLACYKFNIIYGLLVSASRLSLMWYAGGNMSEFSFLTIDCLVLMTFAQSMTLARPKSRLAKRTPTSSLLGPSTMISVISMFAINMLFLFLLYLALGKQSYFPLAKEWNDRFPLERWWVRGDNLETASVFLWCVAQFVNAGLIFTFGGVFRRNAFRNLRFSVMWISINALLLYLTFAGPSRLHCLFRVNCDTLHSKMLESPIVHAVAFAGDGGPFYGELGHNVFTVQWKVVLFFFSFINALVNILFHKFVIDGFPAEYYRSKYPHQLGGKVMPA